MNKRSLVSQPLEPPGAGLASMPALGELDLRLNHPGDFKVMA
jgi:hypothetical protein